MFIKVKCEVTGTITCFQGYYKYFLLKNNDSSYISLFHLYSSWVSKSALVLVFLLISLQPKTLAGVFTDFLSAVFTSQSMECFIPKRCSGKGFWSLPASFIAEIISYIIC